MNIQQLRQSLKIKWVNYYYKNRSWLVKMRIWATYDGQRRPSSSFILATLSVLEPQLEQILPFILELNNNPDRIVAALGLNFNPEEQLNLVKDSFVAENQDSHQFSSDRLVTEKPPFEYIRDRQIAQNLEDFTQAVNPPLQDVSPYSQPDSGDSFAWLQPGMEFGDGAGDRKPLACNAPTKIQVEDKPISSVTLVTDDCSTSPTNLFPHKEVHNNNELTTPIALTNVETNSVIPMTGATKPEIKSTLLASVAVATKIENPTHSESPIAVATKVDSHRQLPTKNENRSAPLPTPIETQLQHVAARSCKKSFPLGKLRGLPPVVATTVVSLPLPILKVDSDAVVPTATACKIESKDKLVDVKQEEISNHEVNPSPTNKVCKLANWIDDFCQGTGWDREEAIFIPF